MRSRNECLCYRHNNNLVAYLGADEESSAMHFRQNGYLVQTYGTARA
jgi:hypothetical protein